MREWTTDDGKRYESFGERERVTERNIEKENENGTKALKNLST